MANVTRKLAMPTIVLLTTLQAWGQSMLQEAYLKASDTDEADLFGRSVAISGDTAVVGAPRQGSGLGSEPGAVYVFVEEGGAWIQQARLTASNSETNDYFGGAVAISGDTLVVGAHFEDSAAVGVNGDQTDNTASSSGAAYVFVRNDGQWGQEAYLKASNTEERDHFGAALSIWGETIVVGAFGEDSRARGVDGDQTCNSSDQTGAAYVFVRDRGTWSQQAYLKASNTGRLDSFGSSVSIWGDTIVVGAPWERSGATSINGDEDDNSALLAGAAYVFVRKDDLWSQEAYLKALNAEAWDVFGLFASISEDTIVVGAFDESSSATGVNGDPFNNDSEDSGAAYVFVRQDNTWSHQAYLKASNTGSPDRFGIVAIDGDTIVVGAYWERSNATGIDGDQTDNSLVSGAAYVFRRSVDRWSQSSYLKASNTGFIDFFGGAVAVSGGNIVVGAYEEDSNAVGVDGDESDNSAEDAGAAYLFGEEPPECFLVIGSTPQTSAFTAGGHTWSVSVGGVIDHYPVLLDDLPTFPLPNFEPPGWSAGAGPAEFGAHVPVGTFFAQVVMYNPDDFPLFPEQWSNALELTIWSHGKVNAKPYGTPNGMHVWLETFTGSDGFRYARLPFSIEGLGR